MNHRLLTRLTLKTTTCLSDMTLRKLYIETVQQVIGDVPTLNSIMQKCDAHDPFSAQLANAHVTKEEERILRRDLPDLILFGKSTPELMAICVEFEKRTTAEN